MAVARCRLPALATGNSQGRRMRYRLEASECGRPARARRASRPALTGLTIGRDARSVRAETPALHLRRRDLVGEPRTQDTSVVKSFSAMAQEPLPIHQHALENLRVIRE